MKLKDGLEQMIPLIQKIRFRELNFSYDEEVDVIYIRVGERKKATRTDDSHYPVLYRYSKEDLIGITIIDYSKK
ncbi:MAG: DUF2283 domain-containing protein [Spirochaetota bacterium]